MPIRSAGVARASLRPLINQASSSQVSQSSQLVPSTSSVLSSLQGTTCSPHSAPCCSSLPAAVRFINVKAMFNKGMDSLYAFINIPKLLNPDIYDTQEKQAAETYKYYNKVMDPYYKQQPLKTWNLYANRNEGWDELERRSRYFFNRVWAQRVCRQSLWGFSNKALKERAIHVYKEVNAALAEGHKGKHALDGIKDLVVPVLFDQMIGEALRLQQSGRMVAWKMVTEPTIQDVKLVNGFVVKAVNSAQVRVSLHFVQWTLEIHSEQSFAVYEKVPRQGQPRLVSGDPDRPIKVVDYWVFERPVLKSWFVPKPGPRYAEWRLVARLRQPEGRPPPLAPVPI